MGDLRKARELEELELAKLFDRLTAAEGKRASELYFDSRNPVSASAQSDAVWRARVEKWENLFEGQIDIRRKLARSFPELRTESSLDSLLQQMNASIDRITPAPPDGPFPVTPPTPPHRYDDVRRLRERAHREIEILKTEYALNLDRRHQAPAVSVNTGGGHAIVNLGTIYGDVQQIVGTLNDTGHAELAAAIKRLATAITEAEQLANERTALLEQLEFIAKQAVAPAAERQLGVLSGLLFAFRARLQDVANVAQILAVAGPAIAHHFGLPWPH
jgi:hypothetical protein